MHESTTDKAVKSWYVPHIGALEYWAYILGFIFLTFAAQVVVNSRAANPACIDFEEQNKTEVQYERDRALKEWRLRDKYFGIPLDGETK